MNDVYYMDIPKKDVIFQKCRVRLILYQVFLWKRALICPILFYQRELNYDKKIFKQSLLYRESANPGILRVTYENSLLKKDMIFQKRRVHLTFLLHNELEIHWICTFKQYQISTIKKLFQDYFCRKTHIYSMRSYIIHIHVWI